MKNIFTTLALLGLAAISAVPNSPNKLDGSFDKIAVAHPDWDLTDIAKRSPACDCEGKCKCAAPCLCNVVDEKPLVVGPPPDIAHVQFTKPAPIPVCPLIPLPPKPVAKAAPAGHWQTVQSCGRGGCSTYQVWVPAPAGKPVQPIKQSPAVPLPGSTKNQQAIGEAMVRQPSYGSCGPGGCGTRVGLFGRRR
jgi:hypothetical protein